MTTLATMKTRIASELRRSNIGTQIADAINTAIDAYSDERWFFNESRDTTFTTVASTEFYSSSAIAGIQSIDYVTLYLGSQPYTLDAITPDEIEILSQAGFQSGQPLSYCYYNQQMRLYPVPNDVWTIRIAGVIKYAAPASDSETGNPWMTDAERLIRSRAKLELAMHVLLDKDIAAVCGTATDEAWQQLKRRTNRKLQQGGWLITPTQF